MALPRARRQRRLARPASIFGDYERIGKLSRHRQLAADSAVLQRRHDDAVYGQRRHAGARRRDAARDPERPGEAQRLRPARAAVRPARAARHRPRRRRRDAEAEARRHGQLHDAEARRRAAVGRQLRLQQRRRGAAALRLAHQRLHHRHRVDEHAQHAARRLQRLVVRQPRADAVWDSPLRLDDASSAPGRGRMSLWPSNSAQTISFGGYTKLAHKTQVTGFFSYGLWSNDEPLQPFTINSALPQIALPRANTDGEAHVFSTNLNLDVAPARPTGGSARASATTPTTTTCRRRRITDMRQLRLARSRRRPPAVPTSTRTAGRTSTRDATWTKLKPFALTVGYTHNGNGYDARIFESSGENVFRVSADAVGSSWLTFRAQYEFGEPHRFGARRNAADGDRRAPGDAPLRPRRPDEEPLHRPGRHRAVGRLDVQRVRRRPARTTSATASSACRSRPAAPSRSPPTTTGRTASARAALQLRALRRTAALARGGFVDGAVQRSAARLDGRFDRDGALLLDLRDAAAHRPQHRGAVLVRLQPRGGQLPLHDPGGQPDYRRPISCPTCSTSCSSCTSTCGTGCRSSLAATFSYLYEPLSIYDFAFDPSVVNGIVQPSSLVLGYVYRPYTANSFVFGLRYLW